MHVAWGRQILEGRLPVRDMVPLGMPLKYTLSVLFEQVVGHRLLSEGLLVAGAFAFGAVLTFLLATKASGSLWIGVIAAVLQVAIAPRTYSYSKIVLYGAAIVLLWRYIDNPSGRRAAGIGLFVAFSFYLRHDHGLYVGVVAAIVFLLRHRGEWRTGLSRAAISGLACLAAVAPYLVYIQLQGGILAYVRDLRMLATREYQQNHFDEWPRWPFRSRDDVFRWTPGTSSGATISVRWKRDTSQAIRRETAARYNIEVADDRPIASGRFLLADTSTDNVLAMLRDPVVEDTAGIDRRDGRIPTRGLRLGTVHLVPAIDSASAAAALLFFVYVGCLGGAALVLLRPGRGRSTLPHERVKMAAVVLVALVTSAGFLRQPLEARIADAVVAPLVLAAWLSGKWLTRRGMRVPVRKLVIRSVVCALIMVPVFRSVAVIGAASPRVERLQDWKETWQRLTVIPAFDGWANAGSAKYRAVKYVRACTSPNDPLLVLWFAPDLYYYGERPFAGRLGFYMEGYWVSADHQRMNLEAIERDRPLIALMQSGREETDLYTYPQLLEYIRNFYHPLGEVAANDRTSIRVLARNDRRPSSIDADLGWPCYR